MVRWEWFLPLGQIGQLVSLSVRVVALSDLARVHSGAQAFSIRHRIVGLFPLAHSDKTSRLDFVEVFPAITTLKFILFFFFPDLTLYHFIDFFKLCTSSLSAFHEILHFLYFLFFCSTKGYSVGPCDQGHARD